MKKFSRRGFLLAGAAAVAAPVVAKATLFTPFKPEFVGLRSWWTPKEILSAETGADGGFIVPKELVADIEKMVNEFGYAMKKQQVVIEHRFTQIERRMRKSERTLHGFSRS